MTQSTTSQEIIINKCYGGWRLSQEAYEWLIKNKGWKVTDYSDNGYKDKKAKLVRNKDFKVDSTFDHKYYAIPNDDALRVDKDVIECVKTLGEKASSRLSKLKIITIPKDIEWEIDEYDGIESVHEKHEVWS